MSLQDDFSNVISLLEDALQDMGVSDAEFDSTTGIMGLVDKILDIPPSVGGIDVVTALSCNISSQSINTGTQISITGILEADKDDTTVTNVDLEGYLKGATIEIYNGNTLLGTAVTNANGEYNYNYTPTVEGTLSIKAVFDGTDDYESCYSRSVSVTVTDKYELSLTSNKDILSYSDNDSATLTATYTKNDVGVSGKTVYFSDGKSTTSATTDANGQATYLYSSQGIGDVTITADCMNLTKTFTVQDWIVYDDATSDKSQNFSLISNPSYASISYDSGGKYYLYNRTYSSNATTGLRLFSMPYQDCEVSIDFRTASKSGDYNAFLWIGGDETQNWNNHCEIGTWSTSKVVGGIVNGDSSSRITQSGALSTNTWYTFYAKFEDGVCTAQIRNASNQSVIYEKTFNCFSMSTIYVDVNLIYSTSVNNIKNIIVKPLKTLSEPLELSCDNPILSSIDNDTATITATYIGGSGYNVELYREVDDAFIEIMTDEGDGTYTYEYESHGVGDLEVYAKVNNITSESCLIEDCIAAKSIEQLLYSGSYTTTNSLGLDSIGDLSDVDFELSCQVNMYAVYGGVVCVGASSQWNISPVLADYRLAIGMDTQSGTPKAYCSVRTTSTNYFYGPQISRETYYPMKIVREGHDVKFYLGDDLITTKTESFMADYESFSIYGTTWNESSQIKVKDIKLKPLELVLEDDTEIDIPVSIIWDDNNNADLNRPSSVTVILYADGVQVDEHEVFSNDNWSYTFTEVPKYREDEETEIIYTVGRAPIDWYYPSVNGYTITNTYAPEFTSASVLLGFNDNDNANGVRPQSVAIVLKRNTTETVNTVVLSESNAWSATVNNLPTMYNGVSCTYAWQEPSVFGYVLDTTNTTENIEGGFTTTFTYLEWIRPEEPDKPPKTPG